GVCVAGEHVVRLAQLRVAEDLRGPVDVEPDHIPEEVDHEQPDMPVFADVAEAGHDPVAAVLGVANGPATRFTAIQIKQRYPGHSRNALHVACSCQGGAYAGKWTVVVDEDIDAGDLDQVLWAMCTRFDPVTDIDLIQKAWASKRDPLYLPGNFNNRILVDACIPYDKKLKEIGRASCRE